MTEINLIKTDLYTWKYTCMEICTYIDIDIDIDRYIWFGCGVK